MATEITIPTITQITTTTKTTVINGRKILTTKIILETTIDPPTIARILSLATQPVNIHASIGTHQQELDPLIIDLTPPTETQ